MGLRVGPLTVMSRFFMYITYNLACIISGPFTSGAMGGRPSIHPSGLGRAGPGLPFTSCKSLLLQEHNAQVELNHLELNNKDTSAELKELFSK